MRTPSPAASAIPRQVRRVGAPVEGDSFIACTSFSFACCVRAGGRGGEPPAIYLKPNEKAARGDAGMGYRRGGARRRVWAEARAKSVKRLI
jgi:hypothetical protein